MVVVGGLGFLRYTFDAKNVFDKLDLGMVFYRSSL